MQMEEFHGNEELFTPKKVDIVHHTPDLFNAEGGREGASLFLSLLACLPRLRFLLLCLHSLRNR